jgi:hypothetical protein
MRSHSFIIATMFCSIQLCPFAASQLLGPSEPVVRGSIRSDLSSGYKCLSVPATETLPGAHLEMRPCRNGADQIFEWNVISFEIKIHKLCVDALRAGESVSQRGDPVGLWYCQGTQHQKWYPIHSSPDAPEFIIIGGGNSNGDLCLDIPNSNNTDGTQLVISTCDGDDSQRFRIQSWPALDSKVSFGPPGQSQKVSLP